VKIYACNSRELAAHAAVLSAGNVLGLCATGVEPVRSTAKDNLGYQVFRESMGEANYKGTVNEKGQQHNKHSHFNFSLGGQLHRLPRVEV
jgi:hypothetical protein